MLTLGHFLETYTDYVPTGGEPPIATVVIDSRQAEAGSLFIAFPGEHVDGHAFVGQAFANGAVAALIERPLPDNSFPVIDCRGKRPSAMIDKTPVCLLVENTLKALQQAARAWRTRFSTRVIAITGSVGKTTTKEVVEMVLSRHFRTLKSEGNQNNEIGVPLTLLKMTRKHERVVVEMGMYAQGEISLLCDLAQPQIGLLTMIAPVHLERLGSIEAIVAAKQELVAALPEDGVAILNQDDPRVMSMADKTAARVFSYGLDDRADLWADDIHSMGLNGIGFTLHYGQETWRLNVPMLGRHSVHTALRATAVALVEGMGWEEIIPGLQQTNAHLRLVTVPGPRQSVIIDDTYNASPDSVLAALNLLSDLNGRRLAILGDMLELGAVEEESHRLVGRRAADVAHVLVAVGQRGRFIGEEALATGMSAEQVHFVSDTTATIPLLEALIEGQDIILVKGSWGMRMDRIVAALSQAERDN